MQSRPQLKSFLGYINGSVLNEEYLRPNTSCLGSLVGAGGWGTRGLPDCQGLPGEGRPQCRGRQTPLGASRPAGGSHPELACTWLLPPALASPCLARFLLCSPSAFTTLSLSPLWFLGSVPLLLTAFLLSLCFSVFSVFSSHSIPSSISCFQRNASL